MVPPSPRNHPTCRRGGKVGRGGGGGGGREALKVAKVPGRRLGSGRELVIDDDDSPARRSGGGSLAL